MTMITTSPILQQNNINVMITNPTIICSNNKIVKNEYANNDDNYRPLPSVLTGNDIHCMSP